MLGLTVMVVVCVLLIAHKPRDRDSIVLESSEPSTVFSASLPTPMSAVSADAESPQLPRLDFPSGSVEEACGFNDLPTYWVDAKLQRNHTQAKVIESEDCRIAFEKYMSAVNPFNFILSDPYVAELSEFVVLKNPFTFERIFTNPAGDLARMQDALARPECVLAPNEINWELEETCYADAFLNYALVNLFCFDELVEHRDRLMYRSKPTTTQDRLMWKQDLEDVWVEEQCEELDTTLKFTPDHYPKLHSLVMSWLEPDSGKDSLDLLVELSARLGNNAAGMTSMVIPAAFFAPKHALAHGYQFGRFAPLLESEDWREFVFKKEPNTDRFLQTFRMLAMFSSSRPDPRDEFEFDWEFVVRHLCEPPFFNPKDYGMPEDYDTPGIVGLSCQEVVHEIRQQDIRFPPLLDVLDKFEQVALELNVYD